MEELREKMEELDLGRTYLIDWAVMDCLYSGDEILREISIDVYPSRFAVPLTFAVKSPNLKDSLYVSTLHGIRSDEGRTKYKYVRDLFVDLIKKNVTTRVVFVRDENQKKYISALLNSWGLPERIVVNIRDFGCPPVRSFVTKWCGNHGTRFIANSTWICTLAATQFMMEWSAEHADRLYIRRAQQQSN